MARQEILTPKLRSPGNFHNTAEVVIKDEFEGQPVVIKIEEDQFDVDIEDCGETVLDVNLQGQAGVIKIKIKPALVRTQYVMKTKNNLEWVQRRKI